MVLSPFAHKFSVVIPGDATAFVAWLFGTLDLFNEPTALCVKDKDKRNHLGGCRKQSRKQSKQLHSRHDRMAVDGQSAAMNTVV